jgi:hypothetical protein
MRASTPSFAISYRPAARYAPVDAVTDLLEARDVSEAGASVPIRCRTLATRSCIFAASSSVRSFDELIPAQVIEHLDLDRVRCQRGQAILVRFARGRSVLECRHSFISTAYGPFRFQLRSR